MPLTPPQQSIFTDPARFRAVSAGRRFGKTYLSLYEIARVARFPRKKIYYVAPTRGQAKNIIWQDLKNQMFSKGWAKKANESELTLELINGSIIGLRTADNFDSMRGVSLDFAVLDECAFMSQETWTQVLRPTLSDRQGGALFISTPQGFNWFYDLWRFAHSNENWSAFQYTTLEGGNVPPEEILAARSDLDLRTFQQEYEASFENAGHMIYYAFDNRESVFKYDGEVPRTLHVGMDFNTNPMSAVIAVQTTNGLHVIDEISLPNSNTDEIASELKNRYPDYNMIVYPDPAGAQRKTSAGGRTDHSILAQWGFTVRAKRAHTSVRDRINAVNRLLCDANGSRKLFFNPKCTESIKCINKHQYKDGTTVPDKNSGYDHMNDALGYMVDYLYPIRRPDSGYTNEPEIFGHF